MIQPQWGERVYQVSDGAACASTPSSGTAVLLSGPLAAGGVALGASFGGEAVHPPLAEADQAKHAHRRRADGREGGARGGVVGRELRVPREPVDLRFVDQQ